MRLTDQLIAQDLACIRGGRLLFSGLGFSLAPGCGILLSGPNGIGKSSLLRILAGLLPASAGSVCLPIATRRIAYLGHNDGLKPLATVTELLMFWSAVNGPSDPTTRRHAVEDAMEKFALGPLATLPCRYLSAGQRRRVALGRVLVTAAPLWFLDEPTSALDTEGTDAIEQALVHHLAAGGMAVIATHLPVTIDSVETLEIAKFVEIAGGISDVFSRDLSVDLDK